MEKTPTSDKTECKIEDVIVLKIGDGMLLISPLEDKCEYSYIFGEDQECYRLILNSAQIDIKGVPKEKYRIFWKEKSPHLIIGISKFKMEDASKDSKHIIDILDRKLSSIAGVNYVKGSCMTGNSYNADPTTGNSGDRKVYTQTPAGSKLTFTFYPTTINYISFTLFDADNRVYYYNIEINQCGEWILLASKKGSGFQELHFSPMNCVSGIRLNGETINHSVIGCLHILEEDFSIKYIIGK